MVIEPEMVILQAGSFMMGSDNGCDYEGPLHEVRVDSFAIGKYPVTFAEYDRFAKATGQDRPDDAGWGRGNRPVINVSWHDATAYTEWLSQQTGKTYRLPREAEWEYACRAGSQGDYCFGDDVEHLKDYAWYWDNSEYQTHPVGEKLPNAFDIYDMYGNVWEWCEDRWRPDRSDWESGGSENRVLRGGSWFSISDRMRSALRIYWRPTYRGYGIGFRVLCECNSGDAGRGAV